MYYKAKRNKWTVTYEVISLIAELISKLLLLGLLIWFVFSCGEVVLNNVDESATYNELNLFIIFINFIKSMPM